MSAYTKLFSSIVHSTVWGEANHVRIVWVTLLALADRDGHVDASVPGLARAAQVSIQECETALEKLRAPDPYSRSPENEGRRVADTDGGWVILNYGKYREKASKEEAKQKAAERQRQKRERDRIKRDSHATSRDVTERQQSNDKADPDPSADPDPPVSPPGSSRESREQQPPPKAPAKRRKPKTPIPEDWTPNAAHAEKAATLGVDLATEATKFRNYAEGKDQRWVDWDKAFHNWLTQAAAFAPRGPAPGFAAHQARTGRHEAGTSPDWPDAGAVRLRERILAGEWGQRFADEVKAGRHDMSTARRRIAEIDQRRAERAERQPDGPIQ